MAVALSLSDWVSAPFELGGQTVFAVGDVHGCADELTALLDRIEALARETGRDRHLIYLGDMIDRGPDNIGALGLWAEDAPARGVDQVHRVMGNHEIMLLLALAGGAHAPKAEAMWLSAAMGGSRMLEEMRAKAGDANAPPTMALASRALGPDILQLLTTQRSHLQIGNTLFVHGGLDPATAQTTFLATPWTEFTDARWAWINQGFLDWPGGFGGTMVVHGHTPPARHRALTGQDDPHLFSHDRLGLDGGSALTGIVTAAELRDGRYRILKAGTPRDDG
jgi:serine/threonine protein phosphatase 1